MVGRVSASFAGCPDRKFSEYGVYVIRQDKTILTIYVKGSLPNDYEQIHKQAMQLGLDFTVDVGARFTLLSCAVGKTRLTTNPMDYTVGVLCIWPSMVCDFNSIVEVMLEKRTNRVILSATDLHDTPGFEKHYTRTTLITYYQGVNGDYYITSFWAYENFGTINPVLMLKILEHCYSKVGFSVKYVGLDRFRIKGTCM